MIYVAADHAGFALKEAIKAHLIQKGHKVEDMGAYSLNPTDDYPNFVIPAVQKVAEDPENSRAIVLGGSGQGEATVANRFKGVRAAVYYGGSVDIVKLSRQHNNANVLSLGARFLTPQQALEAVDLWLATPFEGGRHERRIQKIDTAI
jgi:ribose 5-phosphate isomerase B